MLITVTCEDGDVVLNILHIVSYKPFKSHLSGPTHDIYKTTIKMSDKEVLFSTESVGSITKKIKTAGGGVIR